MTLFGVLHNVDIFDIKQTNNHSIEFVISDFYDFEYLTSKKEDNTVVKFVKYSNNSANNQQITQKLFPYMLYIPVKFTYKELKDILDK